jgi:HEAT repeat protein
MVRPFAILVALACSLPALSASGQESQAARQRVWEFETSLHAAPRAERAEKVRQFFASLKDSNMRIAAVDMMDSRYVYVVPRSVMSEVLRELFKDPDLRVRSRAARAVGYNGLGKDHAEALLALLKDGDDQTNGNVFYAMARSGDVRFKVPLREFLKDPVPGMRASAGWALWTLDPSTVKDVEFLLSDPEPTVRRGVVWFLGTSEKAPALLRDPDAQVRAETARVLGDMKDRRHIPGIAPLLADRDVHVRARAAVALATLGSSAHGDAIEKLMLEDEDVVVRRYATDALAQLRLMKHLPGLRRALKDEDEQVRNRAARAIKLIENLELSPDSVR